jgi:signal transduction histidine kinase
LFGDILLCTIRNGHADHAWREVIMDEQAQHTSGLSLSWLSGGGEMGRQMRAHDWSVSALGRPERWPLCLKNAAMQILATPTPVAVAWGPDQLVLHNDAFVPPGCPNSRSGVGLPFRHLFPEAWQRVGPLLEEVMQRGEAALLENQLFCIYRNGYAEEIYLSFHCDPVADDAADVGGVMITVDVSTDRVICARRTAAFQDLSAAGAEARSLEQACRAALEAVSRHTTDVPFALLYTCSSDERQARLVATAALGAGTAASPHLLALDMPPGGTGWPVGAAIDTNRTVIIDDLLTRFELLPAGDWPLAPRCAAIVPLTARKRGQPDSALILGVSARRALDAAYLDFIERVAKHVVAAMTAGLLREDAARDGVNRAAARVARNESRARTRVKKARVDGVLEERTRLAREIHDTLLQQVTGIALQLRAALPHVQSSRDDALTTLERVADLAETTSREARQVVWDMRPGALNEHEFVRAVEITAHRTVAAAAVPLHFVASGRARVLGEEAQRVVLRIVQEALANVVRHAAANAIRLTLSFGPRRLRVSVRDDGRGFTVERDFRSYAGHWGLVGMQERAEQIGASLRVESAPNRGTTVTLDLRLSASRAKTSLGARENQESAIA